MNDIISVISTLGFPIFSFLLCGAALKFVYTNERKSLDNTIEKIGALTLAVEKNSEAIRALAEKLGDDSNE